MTFQHNELPNTDKHHFPLFSTSMNNQQGGGGYMSGGGQSGGFMSQAPPKEDMAYLCAGACFVAKAVCVLTNATTRLRHGDHDQGARANSVSRMRASHHVQEAYEEKCVVMP